MISSEQALRQVFAAAKPLGEERVALSNAHGCRLASDLFARWHLPALAGGAS